MRFTRRVRKPWETYSRYCGLPSVSKNITVTCGKGKEDLVESSAPLTFPPPRVHACASPLNFGRGMKGNNLAGLGPGRGSRTMRFREVLPGVDLRIQTTDQYKPTNTKRNGRYKRWGGAVNVGPNTDTHFLFSFVNSSDGRRRVMVDSFMFTVFDLDQVAGCQSRTFVEASGYSAYYLSDDTELVVKTDTSDLQHHGPVTTFKSSVIGNGRDNPRTPGTLTPKQAKRAVSFLYERVRQFSMGFGVTEGSQGRLLVFGGVSSITDGLCAEAQKLEQVR